jgi:hypothetical protein
MSRENVDARFVKYLIVIEGWPLPVTTLASATVALTS